MYSTGMYCTVYCTLLQLTLLYFHLSVTVMLCCNIEELAFEIEEICFGRITRLCVVGGIIIKVSYRSSQVGADKFCCDGKDAQAQVHCLKDCLFG